MNYTYFSKLLETDLTVSHLDSVDNSVCTFVYFLTPGPLPTAASPRLPSYQLMVQHYSFSNLLSEWRTNAGYFLMDV